MKNTFKLFSLLLFFSLSTTSFAQFSSNFSLVEVNTTTGAFTFIDSISGAGAITTQPNYSGFNPLNNTYFFRASSGITSPASSFKLFTVSAADGNIISSPNFPILNDSNDRIIELRIDEVTGIIYGLFIQNSPRQVFLVTINPITGVHTIVNNITGVDYVNTDHQRSYFNSDSSFYTFVGRALGVNTPYRLITIDVTTGAIVSDVTNPFLDGTQNGIMHMRYHSASGNTYGLLLNDTTNLLSFITIDPATGTHSILKNLPNLRVAGTTSKRFILDQTNGTYVCHLMDSNNNAFLYTLDLTTGNILSNPSFQKSTNPNQSVTPIEMHYNPVNGKTYGLSVFNFSVTGISELENKNHFSVYPNPFSDQMVVEFDEIQSKITLRLFNSVGKLVKSIDRKNLNKVTLERENLSTGIYFLEVVTDKLNAQQKVIIK